MDWGVSHLMTITHEDGSYIQILRNYNLILQLSVFIGNVNYMSTDSHQLAIA